MTIERLGKGPQAQLSYTQNCNLVFTWYYPHIPLELHTHFQGIKIVSLLSTASSEGDRCCPSPLTGLDLGPGDQLAWKIQHYG